MSLLFSRRRFLNTSVVGLGLTTTSLLAPYAFSAQSANLSSTVLGDNIYLIQGVGCNVVVRIGSNSVLLVDGGLAEHSADLLAYIDNLSGGLPISTLFNTHWHWNNTGSNERLADTGTEIIAHENTRLWLGVEIISRSEQRTYSPRPTNALPTKTFFYDDHTLSFDNENIQYGYLPQAHTDGDIYVYFPESNVLVTGDTFSIEQYPTLDYSTGGWIGGLASASHKLVSLCDNNTKVVPGNGAVQSIIEVQAQLTMSESVREIIANHYRQALDFDKLLAEPPTEEFDKTWGDPRAFLSQAFLGATGHIRELGGIF
jgi:cyclase